MILFRHLLGDKRMQDKVDLLPAIVRAIVRGEPMFRQEGGYPAAYSGSVRRALDYAGAWAAKLPGPAD